MGAQDSFEIAKVLATFGVGGSLAAMIFYFYRKDSQENLDDRKLRSERDEKLLGQVIEALNENAKAFTANAEATRTMTATIESLRRQNDRVSDLLAAMQYRPGADHRPTR